MTALMARSASLYLLELNRDLLGYTLNMYRHQLNTTVYQPGYSNLSDQNNQYL